MTTPQQRRYNEHKPQLTYFFSSDRAFGRFLDLYTDDWGSDGDSPLQNIAAFLGSGPGSHGWRELVDAAAQLISQLEHFTNEAPTIKYSDPGLFLCSCFGALSAYCQVCVYGETKYDRGNYRFGAPVTEYLDSALRHLRASEDGEDWDLESQEPHLAMALWNVWQALDQPVFRDNRLPEVWAGIPREGDSDGE